MLSLTLLVSISGDSFLYQRRQGFLPAFLVPNNFITQNNYYSPFDLCPSKWGDNRHIPLFLNKADRWRFNCLKFTAPRCYLKQVAPEHSPHEGRGRLTKGHAGGLALEGMGLGPPWPGTIFRERVTKKHYTNHSYKIEQTKTHEKWFSKKGQDSCILSIFQLGWLDLYLPLQ